MLTSKNILEIDHLFELLCYVLCCEKKTNDIKNILVELEKSVVGDCKFNNELPEELENETTANENANTYREKSPFADIMNKFIIDVDLILLIMRTFLK